MNGQNNKEIVYLKQSIDKLRKNINSLKGKGFKKTPFNSDADKNLWITSSYKSIQKYKEQLKELGYYEKQQKKLKI